MKVYFDNAATTPLHPKVFDTMKKYLTENFGNPSSTHSFGRSARVIIEETRELIASFINANPSEIYFTSGGTESNNFIISGVAQSNFFESNRKAIITSKAEHNCVSNSCKELERNGYKVEWLEVNGSTKIDINDINKNISDYTSLISLIHVNNETGSINPIKEIGKLFNDKNLFFHTDAVQSFGKYKLDMNELNIDCLSASAHKINGPKGIGFAYVKSGTPIKSLILGGPQERNRRGGTENVAGIAGFAEALRYAQENLAGNFNHVTYLKKTLVEGIKSLSNNSIHINGGELSSPYILSITFLSDYYNNDAEAMLMFLDINGIAASNGAACTSGTWKPSQVILNSGYNEKDAQGTIRFSFGIQNTIDEVEYTLEVINKMIIKFRK